MRYLLLAIVLTGCWPDEDVVLFDEGFEDAWETRWTGDTGLVGTTESVFPGEQAVYWAGTGTIFTTISVTVYDQFSDGLWVEYSSNCRGAPLVSVSGQTLWLELPAQNADLDPTGAWNQVHLTVPVAAGDTWSGDPDVYLTTFYVTASGSPSTTCLFDNIRIVAPAVDHAF